MRNFFLLFFLYCFSLKAQDSLPQIILLDEVQISVSDTGFTVSDFIDIIKQDTSFYMGFKHLRYYPHRFQSELSIFNKKGREIGNLKREGVHNVINDTAWVLIENEQDVGKVYKKNGKYKYYTPEAFDEVFNLS